MILLYSAEKKEKDLDMKILKIIINFLDIKLF